MLIKANLVGDGLHEKEPPPRLGQRIGCMGRHGKAVMFLEAGQDATDIETGTAVPNAHNKEAPVNDAHLKIDHACAAVAEGVVDGFVDGHFEHGCLGRNNLPQNLTDARPGLGQPVKIAELYV